MKKPKKTIGWAIVYRDTIQLNSEQVYIIYSTKKLAKESLYMGYEAKVIKVLITPIK